VTSSTEPSQIATADALKLRLLLRSATRFTFAIKGHLFECVNAEFDSSSRWIVTSGGQALCRERSTESLCFAATPYYTVDAVYFENAEDAIGIALDVADGRLLLRRGVN